MLALLAALESVAQTQIELRAVADIRRVELVEVEEREELCIPGKRGIRPQVGGNLLGLILQNGGARCLQRMVVLQRELDGLFQSDAYSGASCGGCLLRQRRDAAGTQHREK